MIKLFKKEGLDIVISEEAYMLKPFADIWKRDKSKNKTTAQLELAFIYFFADPRSEYQMYADPEERTEMIVEGLGMESGWTPSPLVKEAITFYESFKPASAKILDSTRVLVNKLSAFLEEIDFHKVDDKGKPIYQPNTITNTVKQLPDLISTINKVEKSMNSDIEESSAIRGSMRKAVGEDAFDFSEDDD